MAQQRGRFREVPHSGFPGITWQTRTQKWRLMIYHGGIGHHVGCFESVAEARVVLKLFRVRHGQLDGLDVVEAHRVVKRFRKQLRDGLK